MQSKRWYDSPKLIHTETGLFFRENQREEFYDTLTKFCSDAIRANRDKRDVRRPPYIKDATFEHRIYAKLWQMYNKGELAIEVTYDEESVGLIKNLASQSSLQRLVQEV